VSNAPLLLLHLVTATLLFWLISLRAERRQEKELELHPSPMPEEQDSPPFRVNLLKALVPLVPLGLLFLTALPGLQLVPIPTIGLCRRRKTKHSALGLSAPRCLSAPSSRHS